jgi:Leucine-rich repeat (LRR) protein
VVILENHSRLYDYARRNQQLIPAGKGILLNLTGCRLLSGDLSPLAGLTSLKSLDLTGCKQLSGDLSPLAGLTLLQLLDLYGCKQLSGGLFPLAGLTSLRTLHLDNCLSIRRFAPLESLLPTLEILSLFGCKLDDLPPEV